VTNGTVISMITRNITSAGKEMRSHGCSQKQKNYTDDGARCHGSIHADYGNGEEYESPANGTCLGGGMHPRVQIRQADDTDGSEKRENRPQNQQHTSKAVCDIADHDCASIAAASFLRPRRRI